MRVVVTGASGFIGRYALPLLVAQGHEVFAATTKARTNTSDGVQWFECDLLEDTGAEVAMDAIRPEGLLHLAWYAEHGRFWSAPENFAWCKATADLLAAFRKSGGRRLVISGTCAEYDWSQGYCVEDKTPTAPNTVYGKCKDVTRQYAQAYCLAHGLELAWARIFFPYGLGEPAGRLLPSVLMAMNRGETVQCSHGKQFRDFIHVSDTASALIHLLTAVDSTGIFNIGSGEPLQIMSIINMCASRFHHKVNIDFGSIPVSESDPRMLVASIDNLLNTGWKPATSISQGIDQYVDFYSTLVR